MCVFRPSVDPVISIQEVVFAHRRVWYQQGWTTFWKKITTFPSRLIPLLTRTTTLKLTRQLFFLKRTTVSPRRPDILVDLIVFHKKINLYLHMGNIESISFGMEAPMQNKLSFYIFDCLTLSTHQRNLIFDRLDTSVNFDLKNVFDKFFIFDHLTFGNFFNCFKIFVIYDFFFTFYILKIWQFLWLICWYGIVDCFVKNVYLVANVLNKLQESKVARN